MKFIEVFLEEDLATGACARGRQYYALARGKALSSYLAATAFGAELGGDGIHGRLLLVLLAHSKVTTLRSVAPETKCGSLRVRR